MPINTEEEVPVPSRRLLHCSRRFPGERGRMRGQDEGLWRRPVESRVGMAYQGGPQLLNVLLELRQVQFQGLQREEIHREAGGRGRSAAQ